MGKKEVTNEKLARMIQKGFLEVKSEIKDVKLDLEDVKADLKGVKSDTEQIKRQQMAEVERVDGQDVEIKEIKTRVKVLEKQVL